MRELTADEFRHGADTLDVFPDFMQALGTLRRQRGPQQPRTKERVGLRLDRAIVDHFRATGPGWQSRVNALLLGHVQGVQATSTHPVAPGSRAERG